MTYEDDPLRKGMIIIWILAVIFIISGILLALVAGQNLNGAIIVLLGFGLYIITLGWKR